MSHPKKERNKKIIKLRLKDPKKWSVRKLANEFNIHYTTVHKLVQRETTNELVR